MQWQNTILTILNNNNPSILDLLNYILSDGILARENFTDNVNLPETLTKAKNLLDPDLDIFVRFRHSVNSQAW
jgi:hypothetical protein